jgi:NAD(P)H dehydrogenase (quinone)
MRILVLFAHPLETSFLATLHAQVVEALRRRQHEVDDVDLYSENFNPVMSRQTFINYLDTVANRAQAGAYVDRLLAAEALILMSPVWHDCFPAILKGFFDCVFLPGVSFNIAHGQSSPALLNIKRMTAVCTYGAKRERTVAIGDSMRRLVKRTLGDQIGANGRCDFIALYDMDAATPQMRARYLRRVMRAFSAWT